MAKRVFTDESLETFVAEIKAYTDEKFASVPTESATIDEVLTFIGEDVSEVLIDYEVATVSEV